MLYTPVSIIVGAILVADALHLLKNDGKTDKFNSFTSSVEVVWFIISLVQLFTMELYGLALVIPVLYVSYVIAGFTATFVMMRQFESVEEIQNIQVPDSLLYTSLCFGLIFAGANITLLIFQ